MSINKNIIRTTVQKEYSTYIQKKLLKKLEDKKLIKNDKRIKFEQGMIDVSTMGPEKAKINFLFENMPLMHKMCEEYEYEKGYRYTYLFKYDSMDKDRIKEHIKEGRVVVFTDDEICNDISKMIIANPTYKEDEKRIYIKFSLRLSSKLDNGDTIKHIILVVIHKDSNLLEIRQDIVSMLYNPRDKFYEENTKKVISWLKAHINLQDKKLDLQAIIRHMKTTKKEEVTITALKLKRDGMIAELDAATNTEQILPILDELRKKIYTEEIFEIDDNTRKIKEMLEEFIEDIEENSDLPAAKAYWIGEKYKVNAYHGETVDEIPYLRWIGELRDKESIDYVTRYIMQCERELAAEFED